MPVQRQATHATSEALSLVGHHRNPLHFARALWSSDRYFTVFLFLLVLTVFVMMPIGIGSNSIWRYAIDSVTWLITVGGAFSVWPAGPARTAATSLAVTAMVLPWFSRVFPDVFWLMLTSTIMLVAYLTLLTGVVLRRVFRPGPVDRHRLEAAVAAYILLGLTAGMVFELMALIHPQAFHLAVADGSSPILRSQLIYFSFVTLTSTGYGDVLPVSPLARSFAILEAMMGQLYIAILIGRLVALNLMYRKEGHRRRRRHRRQRKTPAPVVAEVAVQTPPQPAEDRG